MPFYHKIQAIIKESPLIPSILEHLDTVETHRLAAGIIWIVEWRPTSLSDLRKIQVIMKLT